MNNATTIKMEKEFYRQIAKLTDERNAAFQEVKVLNKMLSYHITTPHRLACRVQAEAELAKESEHEHG